MSKAFDNILAGLEDARAYAEGDESRGKARVVEVVDVKAVRAKTGLSQPKFAALFRISVGTLRNWEQGRRQPDGPAVALLRVIEREPETVIRALHA